MEVLAGAVSEVVGVPWVISERSSRLAYPPSFKNRVRIAIARTADAIVSNSSAGDAYWDTRAGQGVRRYVIPNALPFDEIDRVPAAVPNGVPIGEHDAVVLFAGRFGVEKNVERLLGALGQIVTRPNTVAVLCGEGPLKERVEKAIVADKLEDRIFTPGYVTDLWPLMKRADVMVATGLFEGRPNSVLEAMACNLPLVVSEIPAHREILDDRSAYFVNPADTRSVAAAILGALNAPAEARRRAAVARSRAEGWSVPDIAEQYDRVYREVIETRHEMAGSRAF
jgi:glycosyltransferase involved in cell wall biosynthesis